MAGRVPVYSSSSSSSSASSSLLLGLSQRSRSAQYVFSKAILVSMAGGSRVLSYCEPLSCLLASQPSPHSTLVPGYGVKKVSVANMKASQYVPIHSKQIRGLLLTNTVVQTYNAGKPVWSCCWCLDNSKLRLRRAEQRLCARLRHQRHQHTRAGAAASTLQVSVASLCYVPRAASSSFPCGGLIAGSLEGGGVFWEQVNETTYRPHLLPWRRPAARTSRPLNPALRCVLMSLTRTPSRIPPRCRRSPSLRCRASAPAPPVNSSPRTLCGMPAVVLCFRSFRQISRFGHFSVFCERRALLASLTEKMLKLY
ncbi:hypothetical protein F7725_023430, partial [Dissostichus mawsoni]